METKAILKNVTFSAQKGRLIADMVRGQPVEQAIQLLGNSPRRAASVVKKVLESAIANAEHNDGADIDELRISRIFVDEGRTGKRFRARARGRGNRILKRSCHISVVVSDE